MKDCCCLSWTSSNTRPVTFGLHLRLPFHSTMSKESLISRVRSSREIAPVIPRYRIRPTTDNRCKDILTVPLHEGRRHCRDDWYLCNREWGTAYSWYRAGWSGCGERGTGTLRSRSPITGQGCVFGSRPPWVPDACYLIGPPCVRGCPPEEAAEFDSRAPASLCLCRRGVICLLGLATDIGRLGGLDKHGELCRKPGTHTILRFPGFRQRLKDYGV